MEDTRQKATEQEKEEKRRSHRHPLQYSKDTFATLGWDPYGLAVDLPTD